MRLGKPQNGTRRQLSSFAMTPFRRLGCGQKVHDLRAHHGVLERERTCATNTRLSSGKLPRPVTNQRTSEEKA